MADTTASVLHAHALEAHALGLCVVPPSHDGKKRPLPGIPGRPDAGDWDRYKTRQSTVEEIERWYAQEHREGIGLVCGAVSQGLEMFELEGRAVAEGLGGEFEQACEAAGIGPLWNTILHGYSETTPSGGFHVLWCCETTANTKLATTETHACLMETKGEGGYTIIAPSGGTVHPTGGSWTTALGALDTIAIITADERQAVLDVARTFDRSPRPVEHHPRPKREPRAGEMLPGDDYNQRAEWRDLLEPLGWRRLFTTAAGNEHWARPADPGETVHKGTSATINENGNGVLYVFTTGAGLTNDKGYSRFSAYTYLHHNGDFSKASRALRDGGYGRQGDAPMRQEGWLEEDSTDPGHDDTHAPSEEPDWGWGPDPSPAADYEPAQESAPAKTKPRHFIDLIEFLNEPEPEYDWQITDLLEAGDRIILTGAEGDGKSTLLRQWAIQAAAGVHPMTLEPIEPLRVTLCDFENGRRHLKRELRTIWLAAGQLPGPGMLQVVTLPQGVDLQLELHQEYMAAKFAEHHPQIIIAGPLYKMSSGDPTDEPPAKATATFIDRMRDRFGASFIAEAHQPYSAAGGKRPERPYGASLWSRWPEFGLHLSHNGELHHWRGDRDERHWPPLLQRGGQWPWTAVTDTKALTFAQILTHIRDIQRRPTERELATFLNTSQPTIHRILEANRKQYENACDNYGE